MATTLSHSAVCLHFAYNASLKRKKKLLLLCLSKSVNRVCYGCGPWGPAKEDFGYPKYNKN